jgi:hypothetical protein
MAQLLSDEVLGSTPTVSLSLSLNHVQSESACLTRSLSVCLEWQLRPQNVTPLSNRVGRSDKSLVTASMTLTCHGEAE